MYSISGPSLARTKSHGPNPIATDMQVSYGPRRETELMKVYPVSATVCPSEHQRRAGWLLTGPSPHRKQRGKWVTARARGLGASLAPETASSTQL